MTSYELKPCPFCGGKPYIITFGDDEEFIIYCSECGSRTMTQRFKDKAIDTWNRRTNND